MKIAFRPLALIPAALSLCFADLPFVAQTAQAAVMHYWCAPNQPTEYTWKHEIIQPPLSQLFIDRDAKTLRYENGGGVEQFKDGTPHDTDDPHVGLIDRVEFYAHYVHGYQQRIVAPGYATMHNYGNQAGIIFDFQRQGILRLIPRIGAMQEDYTDFCTTTPPAK